MDLLSQEWSHLKHMLAVLLAIFNFPPFNVLKSLRKTIFLAHPVRTGKYHLKKTDWKILLTLYYFFSLLIPIYLAWVVKFIADIENYMNAVERVLEYTDLDKES